MDETSLITSLLAQLPHGNKLEEGRILAELRDCAHFKTAREFENVVRCQTGLTRNTVSRRIEAAQTFARLKAHFERHGEGNDARVEKVLLSLNQGVLMSLRELPIEDGARALKSVAQANHGTSLRVPHVETIKAALGSDNDSLRSGNTGFPPSLERDARTRKKHTALHHLASLRASFYDGGNLERYIRHLAGFETADFEARIARAENHSARKIAQKAKDAAARRLKQMLEVVAKVKDLPAHLDQIATGFVSDREWRRFKKLS